MDEGHFSANLSNIKSFLTSHGYQVEWQESAEPWVVKQLLVGLGKATKDEDLILRIFESRGQESELFKEGAEGQMGSDLKFLQFVAVVPQLVEESAAGDVARWLATVNALLDMANFCFIESERVIYYRYLFITGAEQMSGNCLIAILSSIQFLFEIELQAILDVASGKKSYQQLLAEGRELLRKEEFQQMDGTL